MQDLTLVGLSEDRQRLILVSDSGEEFSLPADAKLRAALRGDHARLGQLEIEMDSALRPRDIQARIRSGENPESVAAAAQTTVERIMVFANPVLAERAHIAQHAQSASVRRKAGEGPSRTLGDAAAERLRTRSVDPSAVDWDSWRREDGRWTLVADYRAGERRHHAEFVFDRQGRYVVAENDEARWLVGEPSSRQAARAAGGPSAVSPRLSPAHHDEELPLGADAIELVRDDGGAPEEAAGADEPTVDLTRTARELRRRQPAPDPGTPSGDADWIATQASDRPETAEPAAQAQQQAQQHAQQQAQEPTQEPTQQPDAAREPGPQAVGAEQDTSPEEPAEPEEKPARKPAKKKGRASVPSWDEIMFGGGKPE